MKIGKSDIDKLIRLNKITGTTSIKQTVTMDIKEKEIDIIFINNGIRIIKTIETDNTGGKKQTIAIPSKKFGEALEEFKCNKGYTVDHVRVEIGEETLTVRGNMHSDELDVITMGYTENHKIDVVLPLRFIDIQTDNIEYSLDSYDEWDTTVFKDIISNKVMNDKYSKVYIQGNKERSFNYCGDVIIENTELEGIGHNIILEGKTIIKVLKMLDVENYEKIYIKTEDSTVYIQSWDGRFKVEMQQGKYSIEEVKTYERIKNLKYDKIHINILKHIMIDSLDRYLMQTGQDTHRIRISVPHKGVDGRIMVGDSNINIYNMIHCNSITDKEIKIEVNVNILSKLIRSCESDFVAIDIGYLTETSKNSGGAIRVSELDLEKYEEEYEKAFSNISHFDQRHSLNSTEHIEMREKCIGKKNYILFV